ncbi:LacI family DNA-binding transcriptional regulator [Vreelandella glaciei]|uniref:LacI family DNA-binding transcriptional regulator n=1 Tax=Vreelandella glaciei TaxID=186761 RepID=UPI003001AB8B
MPIVMIDGDPVHTDITWTVNIDHTMAPRVILDALLAEGRQRITFISGSEDNTWNRDSIAEYVAWCAEQGVKADHHEVYEGEGINGAIRIARDLLLARPERPAAILTGPSSFAHGVLDVAQDLGICVPHELALACLSDSELTRSSRPPITSLDLCMEEVGAEAVRLAIALSNGDAQPDIPVLVSPNVHWRTSLPQPSTLR